MGRILQLSAEVAKQVSKGESMKNSMLSLILGILFSSVVFAGTNPSQHEQVEMHQHLKVAKHAVAQSAVTSQKEGDKKTAQSKTP